MVGGFSFYFNRHLLTGPGSLSEPAKYMPVSSGKLGLIVAPSFLNSERGDEYKKLLEEAGFKVSVFSVHGEPGPDTVDDISSELGSFKPDIIIAVGGGSVLDTGKAVSAMIPVIGRVEDYLEGVGSKKPSGEKIPFVAVPTTSGTGSEATMNGVVSKKGPDGYKKSLRHPSYIPDAAVLDPELVLSCPPNVTAACGMDAFSQLLESYVSRKAGPLSDALAYDGLKRFLRSFDLMMENLSDRDLRSEIALVSYYSGLNLANAGLGIVHGLAGPVGGFSHMPHGSVCGTLLHDAFRMTVEKLKGTESPVLNKLAGLGSFLAGRELPVDEGCGVLLSRLESWKRKYEIPRLSDYGFSRQDLEKIAAAGGNKDHPVEFSREDMFKLLECRL